MLRVYVYIYMGGGGDIKSVAPFIAGGRVCVKSQKRRAIYSGGAGVGVCVGAFACGWSSSGEGGRLQNMTPKTPIFFCLARALQYATFFNLFFISFGYLFTSNVNYLGN